MFLQPITKRIEDNLRRLFTNRTDGVKFSLADEFQLQPTQIHAWVKQVLDRAEQAFASTGRPVDDGKDRKIAALQEKLAKKNEVVAELMEEHVQLKKELGEL